MSIKIENRRTYLILPRLAKISLAFKKQPTDNTNRILAEFIQPYFEFYPLIVEEIYEEDRVYHVVSYQKQPSGNVYLLVTVFASISIIRRDIKEL